MISELQPKHVADGLMSLVPNVCKPEAVRASQPLFNNFCFICFSATVANRYCLCVSMLFWRDLKLFRDVALPWFTAFCFLSLIGNRQCFQTVCWLYVDFTVLCVFFVKIHSLSIVSYKPWTALSRLVSPSGGTSQAALTRGRRYRWFLVSKMHWSPFCHGSLN